jgi:hypothetical protein
VILIAKNIRNNISGRTGGKGDLLLPGVTTTAGRG